MVCDPVLCKQISDTLIDRYSGLCPANADYPTVSRGTERLRVTPSPHHSDADIEHLVKALAEDLRRKRMQNFRQGGGL